MLARSGGFARCGHCHQVFDARSNLLDPHAGTHDVSEAPAQAAPSPEADREPHPRDEHREPTPGAGDETVSAPIETEPSAEGAAGFAEPPISAEVPPLVAPVFAPEGEHFTSTSEPPYVDPTLAEPTEPTADERAPSTREGDWSSHWHDDEPRLNGGVQAEAAEAEAAGEAHLEPHLRARLHAGAEEEAEIEPHFGAAPDESRMRAAGVPPHFQQPPAPSGHERHFTVTRETRARSPGRALGYLVGGIVALALIVTLIAQLAWWRREAIMVYWPDSQALFVRACARLGCQILPPRDIDGLQVEASDLRQVDGPHRLELRVPLRNRYGIALAYPAIELTLFDSSNDVAIRRILWPQDYLPPGTAVAAGLPAHTTQTMIVRLDSGNAIATNFRVQIFYP